MSTEIAAQDMLADLVTNGGGTYERRTLAPFTPPDGYAVGVGGISLPFDGLTSEQVAWAVEQVTDEADAPYVGTWLDGGTVWFDAVLYFAPTSAQSAWDTGIAYGQQAIYDFAASAAINLTGGVQ